MDFSQKQHNDTAYRKVGFTGNVQVCMFLFMHMHYVFMHVAVYAVHVSTCALTTLLIHYCIYYKLWTPMNE